MNECENQEFTGCQRPNLGLQWLKTFNTPITVKMQRETASGKIFGLLTGKEPLTALDPAGIVPAVNASFRICLRSHPELPPKK